MDIVRKISSIKSSTFTEMVLDEKNAHALSWGLTLSTPKDSFFEVPSQTMTLNSEIHRTNISGVPSGNQNL